MRSEHRVRDSAKRRSAAIASALLVALAACAGLAASAQAATFTVGTSLDVTGTCASPASGTCSLRQLVTYEDALVATPSPPDTIIVPAGTYNLVSGELEITQSIAIAGAGARTTNVDVPAGVPPKRVFDVKPPTGGNPPTVVISGLEISGGTANEGNGFFGGDVYNAGQLVLNEDWITAGTASSGGGVSNDTGTLVVEHSLVSGNHASTGGGDSGGIQNHGSAVCVAACSPGKKAVLTVQDSTVADNDARLGAGIFSWSDATDGNEVLVIDSTIAHNSTQNESSGGARGPGGGLLISDGTAEVAGSILAYNSETVENFTNSNCSTSGTGTIVSLGYNLETEADCGFKSTGDLQNQLPNLRFTSGEPQDNGGNTDTLALEPTSAGVDAIPTSSPFCAGTDQRGVTRPQGAGCDIGAVELVPFTIEATEGSQFSGQVAASPPCGIETRVTPTIEWGDGQKSNGTVTETGVSASHTYAEEGTFNGSVSYVNDCGSHKVAFQAKVVDAPLSAAGAPVSATAGVQFNATVATFKDADPGGLASDYTASINWDDGSTTAGTISAAGGGFAVTGTHTYASGGAYQISVTIKDVGGSTATATSSADVATPAPPATPLGPPTFPTTASPPTVLTTTSATFSATVNPGGLPTSAYFEYGPALGGGTGPITYGSVTPSQSVGSDFANHTVTATVTELLPNVTYHDRVVVTNSAGSTQGADQAFNTPADPPPPPPVLGKSVNVSVVSGVVLIELPPGATLASRRPPARAFAAITKGRGFVPLTEARQIPVGSILDTTAGVARITTATSTSAKGKLQSGDFGAGLFRLLQNRRQRGLTELNLFNVHPARQVCVTAGKARIAAKHLSSSVLGRLNANSHGHFTARGQYSAATVRGTIWGVENRCDGTLTKVTRGVVQVRDFRLRKTVTLFTGMSYLARAPVTRG